MTKFYTDEKQAQILIYLLKAHGVKRVIASPGTTNMAFVGSIQNDPYFEIFSCVDERSSAYMACGMAAESGEPVVLSCTGATASRNYMPGLTEAFYRKLPVIAVTSHQGQHKVGHHIAQVIDRNVMPNDVCKLSVHLPIVKDEDDVWDCEIKVNQALLETKRHGGGPVHINLTTGYSNNYDVKELPNYKKIDRFTQNDTLPELPEGRIAIFIGAHKTFTQQETAAIDAFCVSNNAVVFCDHTSGYNGNFRVLGAILASQEKLYAKQMHVNLLIHIGEISGDYFSYKTIKTKQVWRISLDGEIRDTFGCLKFVFEMDDRIFFEKYSKCNKVIKETNQFLDCVNEQLVDLNKQLPQLPFSNIWVASFLAPLIPADSTIHFAILNSLRAWNFFELPESVTVSSNVGGFGIDGCLSSLIGASMVREEQLYFCVTGDLAFFYDMNILGNRHIGNNLRILVINNGVGQEFKNHNHPASKMKTDADKFIAAGGHNGNQSKKLIKHYAQDLGFEYLSATSKEEFEVTYTTFVTPEKINSPILFEIFTSEINERDSLELITNAVESLEGKVKDVTKRILGKKNISRLNNLLGK